MRHITEALKGYSYLDAPFTYSGGDRVSVSGFFIDIDWKTITYPSGAVRHAELRFMGSFEGHLMTREGVPVIENASGTKIGRLDFIDQCALAALLLERHEDRTDNIASE